MVSPIRRAWLILPETVPSLNIAISDALMPPGQFDVRHDVCNDLKRGNHDKQSGQTMIMRRFSRAGVT
jgi:hypothetical protein